MTSLRELSLTSNVDLLGLLLNFDFPWHQLTFLKISWRGALDLSSLFVDKLRSCISVVRLELESNRHFRHVTWEDGSTQPILLPSLKSLTVGHNLTPFVIKHFVPSANFHSLELREISLTNFYTIVSQCRHLAQFTGIITETAISAEPIESLQLSSLDLKLNDFTMFPNLLTTPHLTSLTIKTLEPFPVQMTIDFLGRSRAKLSHLECTAVHPTDSTAVRPAESLLPLFALLDTCSSVHIRGFVFPQSLLDSIASRSLVPHLKSLSLGGATVDSLLSTINCRLHLEEQSGHIELRDITGYLPIDPEALDDLDDTTEEIEKRFKICLLILAIYWASAFSFVPEVKRIDKAKLDSDPTNDVPGLINTGQSTVDPAVWKLRRYL
ncbi:hypothetical protein H0H93_002151 [Arthromyces matolae]|nr:hypothetical protein H0H93_002151 [Arthromyces matolae]